MIFRRPASFPRRLYARGRGPVARFPGARRVVSYALLVLAIPGCGQNFVPPAQDAAGGPAAPLGQVVDLDVSLPALQILNAASRGAELELALHIEGAGPGRHEARVEPGEAFFDGRRAAIEDLSDGRATVTVTDTTWTTNTLGPFRVEGTVFEVVLHGELRDAGWRIEGRSWESQTGLEGLFQGWRRHRFLVTTTDFFSGGSLAEVAWVRGRAWIVREDLTRTSADPVVRRTARSVFVVNRLSFDNVQRLDPDRDFQTIWQAATGMGSNPHDVALVSDEKLYVTRYEPPFNDVAVLMPQGGTFLRSIPLGDLASNPDATPRADHMAMAEGWVFVGLQDMDTTFTRVEEGKLAVLDPGGDQVVGVVPLMGKNPGAIEVVRDAAGGTRLYVALAGIFPGLQPQELSGGVVVVDPVNLVAERFALDDDTAGGNVTGLAIVSPELGYVVVSDDQFRNRVLAFDPRTGDVLREVRAQQEFIPEIEADSGGLLAVPDRTFSRPGLCLYAVPADPKGAEALLGCAPLSLPPFSVEALD